jgi:hypothetical protein
LQASQKDFSRSGVEEGGLQLAALRSRSFLVKTRLFAMGLAILSAGLVACGGGGGGGGGYTPPQSTPTPVPTVTPTPSPTPVSFGCVGQSPFASSVRRTASVSHPLASGDAFNYTGTLSKTYTQSAPCPEPTSTTSATVTVAVKNTAAPSPAGATDVQNTETDAFPTQSTTTTTDQIVQTTASAYELFSTTSADTNGNSITTAYANPQILDKIPETPGDTWSNGNPAATVTETLADGSRVSRMIASDGSYTDTETYGGGGSATIAVNGVANGKPLDGSGDYNFGGTDFSYAAPSAGNITLTILQGGVVQKSRTFPAWFTKPSSYITDTFADNGSQALPSACNVPSSIATSGQQIVETYNLLDPVLGYTDKRVTTSYVVTGYGAACVTIADTMNSYYDYADDTTRIDYQSENGQPNSVSTIGETIGMQSATCAGGPPCPALRRSQSVHGVSPVTVAMRVAAIEHQRSVQRAAKLQSLRIFAKQFSGKGGVQQ